MAEAARTYADAAWSEDLLMRWATSANTNRPEKLPFDPGALFATLDAQRCETVLRRFLELNPTLVGNLTGARSDPWSLEFSRFVVQHLASWFATQHYSLLSFVREATLLLDPRVLPDTERLLDMDIEPIWARSSVDRLVDTLDYRLAMRKELAE
jgi:hypothetical protein